MTVKFGTEDITTNCKTDGLTSITCIQIPNVPSSDIVITGGDSTTYSSFILTPYLLHLNNNQVPTIGSKVTIIGKFFELSVKGNPTQTLSVIVNGNQSSNLKLLNNSSIEFTMPPGQEDGEVNTIAVQSTDKVSNSLVYYYKDYVKITSVTQINQGLKINGYGFKISSDNVIEFGSLDITSSCIINSDTDITCETLPAGSQSSYFKISGSGGASNYKVLLTPVLISISKNVLNSAGEAISIVGRFFEKVDPTTSQQNVINVYIDSNPTPMQTTVQTEELITVSIVGGYGATHKVVVKTENRVSNSISYSYNPPIVTGFSQIREQFYVSAEHFSRDDMSLNKIFVNDIQVVTGISLSNNDELEFILPPTTQNGQLVLVVDGQKSVAFDIALSPIIKSFSPLKPYMDGSIAVTLNGLYFSNKNFKTGNTIDLAYSYILESDLSNSLSLTCEYLNSVSAKCINFKGYGNGSLLVTKTDGSIKLVSYLFGFNFQEPKVVKSTSLHYKQGSNITITAESFLPENLQVFVEQTECLNPVALDNRHIQCFYDASIPPKENGDSLNVTVISHSMKGTNQVLYYHDSLKCENNCTAPNGVCNEINGYCECTQQWEGIDCSIEKQTPVSPPEIKDNGDSNLQGAQINFTISIAYLRENNIMGDQVKLLDMKSIKWVNKTITGDKTSYFRGTFDNDPAIVELDVTYYKDALNYDFAGDIISIPDNSVKYVITVSNWDFDSSLNTFQLVYNAQTKKTVTTSCSTIETNSTESSVKDQSVSWFQITSGTSVLNGKFARRIFADDAVKKSSITILPSDDPLYKLLNESATTTNSYNKLTAINAPYFRNNVILDPSFSSLLRPSDGSDKCSSASWKIPTIAALCSVGGAAIVAGASVTIYKKKKFQKFEKKIKNLSVTS
ncbi:hypothetical protein DICPUDRAFT_30544 [Dictyostelium purpureum]|uniref:EGF-like domain-containing protein n=1 Tax=Dictyostelium purpureum TaxID=5786 RepID=F0ZFJ5_DICPU|nr:uncharacterized protein DICPUDRAFT_30544 [Dictyostelium purpureum]EGC37291.1 hypothetical protein DICPUDRAFT_30544 [Dictyostelium purpureum]|eukprot:XP_003286179.1 hypothetical protein DICPUDRAFT_30544 [Dictyostelium purpureum]